MKDSKTTDAAHEATAEPSRDKQDQHYDFGKILSEARKAKKLTIADVHEHIKISEPDLRAIEASDAAALPAAAFTRGYIRTYARFLEISDQDVLGLYDRTQPAMEKPEFHVTVKSKPVTNSQTPVIKLVTAMLIVSGVAALLYASFQYYQEKADAIETQRETQDDDFTGSSLDTPGAQSVNVEQGARLGDDGELQLQGPAATDLLAEEVDASDSASSASAENDVNPPVEEVDETVQETIATSPGDDTIEFFAEQGSWMEVRDANNARLFYNALPEGGRRTLRGQAPFSVSMGNARTTTVKINGHAVDLSGRIRSNNTARFKVSSEDSDVIFH
jgi:cytoskeleton protein RodZ